MEKTLHLSFEGTPVEVSGRLQVPPDPALALRLQAKVLEYRGRLENLQSNPDRAVATRYKLWVLRELLERGEVDYNDLSRVVAQDYPQSTQAQFHLAYAWKVIENYCLHAGEGNVGGTGLPDYWSTLESALHEKYGADEPIVAT